MGGGSVRGVSELFDEFILDLYFVSFSDLNIIVFYNFQV